MTVDKNLSFVSRNIQAHHLQYEKLNFLLKFCVKMLLCRHYFSSLNTCIRINVRTIGKTFMRKRKAPDPDPKPLTNGYGSGRPRNMRILRIRSGSPTLKFSGSMSTFWSGFGRTWKGRFGSGGNHSVLPVKNSPLVAE
jgi:hypothetical protein